MNRYHYFSYYAPAKATTKTDVRGDFHRFRDAYVLLNLGEVMHQTGYEYGTVIANVPLEMQEVGRESLIGVEPALSNKDLLVVPTRSPLNEDDAEIRPRRSGVRRSFLPLEQDLFVGLAAVFGHLDRERAILANHLRKGAGVFGEITFHQNTRHGHTGGCIRRFGDDTEPGNPIGVGYIATIPRLAVYPCRVLTIFGMGGFETLLLSYIVRARLQSLIADILSTATPRIVVVTFTIPTKVAYPVLSFDMDELNPQVVFDSA